ncbi:MAG TPA: ATP-binding protein [Devosiaceae bacterium]
MRSTEQSGVEGKGFVSARSGHSHPRVTEPQLWYTSLRNVTEQISPITIVVTLTALLAASLFILFDLVRALDEARTLGALPGDMHLDQLRNGLMLRGAGAVAVALLVSALTFRRRNRDGLSLNRRHFEELIATIPFGVACWTPEGRLTMCNDHYRHRLGLSESQMLRGSSYQGAVRHLVQGGYLRIVNEDENNRLLELHREDNSCLLIDERPLGSGGFVTLVTDVTEHKRTGVLLDSIREEQRQLARRYHEEKLRAEAASRSKTNFLAHLSHDIRTPLNHIIGFAELMQHQSYGPLGDSRYAGYVDTIKQSGERLLASFATILELAEFEGGRRVLRQDRVDLDALVKAATDRFKAQAHRAGLRFSTGSASNAILKADPLALQRMIGNILDNAIRFTPAGGKVTIAAFSAEDGVVLEISDTGIGMSEERLASLSQPFVLGDATFTRKNGAGLGIAIARAIAEQSGGRLAIDSSPALGTTVAISLPLPPPARMSAPQAVAA